MSETDQLFGILRGNVFRADPNQIPQESIPIGGGNVQPTGWYGDHGFSSSLAQKNLLLDATLETIPSTAVTVGTAETACGPLWAAHYVLVSGSAPTVQVYLGASRVSVNNTFNSAMLEVYGGLPAASAGKIEVYVYPNDEASLQQMDTNRLTYLVAGMRLTRLSGQDFTSAHGTVDVYLELQENAAGWVTRATSPKQDGLLIGGPTNLIETFTTAFAVAATNQNAWRPRIKIVVDKTSATDKYTVFDFGEPVLAYSYTLDAPPYIPAVGTWFPLTQSIQAQSILAATQTIQARRMVVSLSPDAAYTMTSAPTIPDGQDGQVVTLFNQSANNLTLQDQGTLASSNLRLTAATVTLTPRDSIQLIYHATVGDWVQI